MEMYMFEIVSTLLGLLISIIGFFLKKLYSRIENNNKELKEMIRETRMSVKEVDKEVEAHKLLAARTYLDKSEILIIRDEIKHMGKGLCDRLNGIEEHLRRHYDRREFIVEKNTTCQ
jgi:hypothetical protein